MLAGNIDFGMSPGAADHRRRSNGAKVKAIIANLAQVRSLDGCAR